MSVKSYVTSRSLNTRADANDNEHRQGRSGSRLVVGRVKVEGSVRKHRAYIDLDFPAGFWGDVEVVTAADLQLTIAADGSSDVYTGDTARIKVQRNVEHFSTTGAGGSWDNKDYEPHRVNSDQVVYAHCGTGEHQTAINIGILSLVRQWAPKHVRFRYPDGKTYPGLDKAEHGISITGRNEGDGGDAAEFYSTESGTVAFRPTITLTYVRVNIAPVVSTLAPAGSVTSDFDYRGTFEGPEPEDSLSKVEVEVRKAGKADVLHHPIASGISADEAGEWLVGGPPAGLLAKGNYEWHARVWDQKELASAWTGWRGFTITSIAPIVTALPLGAKPSMAGVEFNAPWVVDATADGVDTVDIQLQRRGGSWTSLLWSESYTPTSPERDRGGVLTEYRGSTLVDGAYDWRVRITDGLGGISSWSTDATLVITEPPPPTEWEPVYITGWNRPGVNQRILIKAMRPSDRGPGRIIGMIENASNIGCSWYASAPGELYFTLPTTHPQVSVIEPLNAHYEFQQYRQGSWVTLAYGLIRDFDATEEETVFYGMDYLGLLSWSIEHAHQGEKDTRKNISTNPKGSIDGSRYFQKTIGKIIRDQLERARVQDAHSPVKFIQTGRVDAFDSKITIFASYAERLGFIRGLIDSHKGAVRPDGGERRSRVRVIWNPKGSGGAGHFQFDAIDNTGSDKNNMRLEYGGLIQGYQVIALDDFATRVYAIGKEPNASRPYFHSVDAKGINPAQWGHIGVPGFWEDVVDKADLIRRANALAIQRSRVGKRMALGLRVAGLDPFDGFDILDAIPVVINDGIVDTSLYGSGYWVIWGVEWRVFPDAHDELTLIVRPRGDRADIEPDLIPSDPIHFKTEWKWGPGPPPSVLP